MLLKDIQDFYVEELLGKIFRYTLKDNSIVDIVFYREGFTHLLGLQHVVNNRKYLGGSGYSLIENGLLTLDKLKQMNRKGYALIKNRIFQFPEIKMLLMDGAMYKFYLDRSSSIIRADFILENEAAGFCLHLFLSKEQSGKNLYTPISYVVLSNKDKKSRMYIQNQEYKKIVSREIIASGLKIG